MPLNPVYKLKDFKKKLKNELCYVNYLSSHLTTHQFINAPHRHDFFLVVFVTAGAGTHSIDFIEYPVKPNCLFLMQPGQIHNWRLSPKTEGYVFFHSREFYEQYQNTRLLNEFPFYRSIDRKPFLTVDAKNAKVLKGHFEELFSEYNSDFLLRDEKLRVYINSLYLDITRVYGEELTSDANKYLIHLREFQDLLEMQFNEFRAPEYYARKLKMTVKHLNRITKTTLNKTATELIADRVVLEAKRLLGEGENAVGDVAFRLNFSDLSYFTRFFKKHTGMTPVQFSKGIHL